VSGEVLPIRTRPLVSFLLVATLAAAPQALAQNGSTVDNLEPTCRPVEDPEGVHCQLPDACDDELVDAPECEMPANCEQTGERSFRCVRDNPDDEPRDEEREDERRDEDRREDRYEERREHREHRNRSGYNGSEPDAEPACRQIEDGPGVVCKLPEFCQERNRSCEIPEACERVDERTYRCEPPEDPGAVGPPKCRPAPNRTDAMLCKVPAECADRPDHPACQPPPECEPQGNATYLCTRDDEPETPAREPDCRPGDEPGVVICTPPEECEGKIGQTQTCTPPPTCEEQADGTFRCEIPDRGHDEEREDRAEESDQRRDRSDERERHPNQSRENGHEKRSRDASDERGDDRDERSREDRSSSRDRSRGDAEEGNETVIEVDAEAKAKARAAVAEALKQSAEAFKDQLDQLKTEYEQEKDALREEYRTCRAEIPDDAAPQARTDAMRECLEQARSGLEDLKDRMKQKAEQARQDACAQAEQAAIDTIAEHGVFSLNPADLMPERALELCPGFGSFDDGGSDA
jgi:hypothetical protein